MESTTRKMLTWSLAAAGAAGVAYGLVVRPWHRRWGAEPIDIKRPMPGDDIVSQANHVANRAITVHAKPADIWPWLVRVGQRDGAEHIYARIQNIIGYIEGPGADDVLPERQRLNEGDILSVGAAGDLRIAEMQKERALVLVPQSVDQKATGDTASWSIMLNQFAPEKTRLVYRARLKLGWSPRELLYRMVTEPAAFLMFRKWFLSVKERAECTADIRRADERLEQSQRPRPEYGPRRQLPPEFNQ